MLTKLYFNKKILVIFISIIITFFFYNPASTLSDGHIPPQEQQPVQTEPVQIPSPKQIPSTEDTVEFPTKIEVPQKLPSTRDLKDIPVKTQDPGGTEIKEPIPVPNINFPTDRFTPKTPTAPIVYEVVVSDCVTRQPLSGADVELKFLGNKQNVRSNLEGIAKFEELPQQGIEAGDVEVKREGYKKAEITTSIFVSRTDNICITRDMVVAKPTESPVVATAPREPVPGRPADASQPTPTEPQSQSPEDQPTATTPEPTDTPSTPEDEPESQTPEDEDVPHKPEKKRPPINIHRQTEITSGRSEELIYEEEVYPETEVGDPVANEIETDEKISTVARLLREKKERERLTTITRKELGKTRERDKEEIHSAPEEQEDIHLTPGDRPPTIYGEELEDEELLCEARGNSVYFPVTTAYLKPEKLYEAYNEPAVGAQGVLLHNSSLLYQPIDMLVKSVGLNFMFTRSYRSAAITDGGGLIGQKWDFNFNKNLLPLGGTLIPKFNMKVETQPADVEYRNGTGRVDRLVVKNAEIRRVLNYQKDFKAHVTTYIGSPGLFAELQRYALFPSTELSSIPFSEHPNFEGKMFYVLRYKNGYQEVYNCRGQIIYAMDRHGALDPESNVMMFKYKTPLNPLTQNPMLYEIKDTAGRIYKIEPTKISSGLVRTNYRGKVINGSFPILRIKKLIDPEGRETEFKYGDGEGGPVIKERIDTRDGKKFITKYEYGTGNLLQTVTKPNENEPYFTINYSGSRIVSQSLGKTTGTHSRFHGPDGATYRIQGSAITDPNGNTVKHIIGLVNGYPVRKELIEQTQAGQARTVYSYNSDLQMTKVVYPKGNETVYEYDTANEKMPAIGDVRDWRPKFTYENDLSKGNLLKVTHRRKSVEHDLDYDEISISYEYEPRFNSITSIAGPGAQKETRSYKHGFYATAGNNGNPLSIEYKRLGAEGGKLSQTFKYNKQGLMLSEEDGREKKSYTYTPAGYLTGTSSSKGTVTYRNDARGNLTGFTNERGVVTTYEVNQRDLTTKEVLDSEGFKNEILYEYDDFSNMTKKKILVQDNIHDSASQYSGYISGDPYWQTYNYDYNRLNSIIATRFEAGGISYAVLNGYDANQNLVRIKNPDGSIRANEYTQRNLIKSETLGNTTKTYKYDKNGNLIEKTDGNNNTTTFTYDGFDRNYKVKAPDDTEIVNILNPDGTVKDTKVTGKNHTGSKVLLSHTESETDEFKRVTKTMEHILDSNGNKLGTKTIEYKRDRVGRVTRIIEDGNTTNIRFENGRKRSETDPLGNKKLYTWDGDHLSKLSTLDNGRRYTVTAGSTEPRARSNKTKYDTTFVYDNMGRLVKRTAPDGTISQNVYDSLGNVRAEILPGSIVHVHEYDGAGRKKKTIRFANIAESRSVTHMGYDLNSRLNREQNVYGNKTITNTYDYNEMGKVTQASYGGKTYTYSYDNNGNVKNETYPNGISVNRTYNNMDRVTSIKVSYGGSRLFKDGSTEDIYDYDGLGRITLAERKYSGVSVKNLMQYASTGDILSETQDVNGNAYTFNYEYDDSGSRAKLRFPSLPNTGNLMLDYSYDVLGRLTSMQRGSNTLADITYFDKSRVSKITADYIQHGVSDYDLQGRLSSFKVFSTTGGEIQYSSTYAYEDTHSKVSSTSIIKPSETTDISYTYTPWGALDSIINVTSISKPNSENIFRRFRKQNFYSNGLISSSISFFAQRRRYPGTVYGTNRDTFGEITKTTFGYNSSDNMVKDKEFKIFNGSYNDRWADVLSMVDDDSSRKLLSTRQANPTYDDNGNIVEDSRYRYRVDYRDKITRADDKYRTMRDFQEYANYYYDYLNRPVMITWGPNNNLVDTIHTHRRFLYDGSNLVADLKSDRNGNGIDVNLLYLTHPASTDVFQLFAKSGSNSYTSYTPHFNSNGELAVLADSRGSAKDIEYKFDHKFERRARLQPVIMNERKVNIPIIARGVIHDPFTGNVLNYTGGGLMLDPNKDYLKEWNDLVNYNQANLSEVIVAYQKKGMAAMSVAMFPLVIAEPFLLIAGASNVVIDLWISAALNQEVTAEDMMISFGIGMAFGAFGKDLAAMNKLSNKAVREAVRASTGRALKAAVAKNTAKKADDVLDNALAETVEEYSIKASERLSMWNWVYKADESKYLLKIHALLEEAANKGNKVAQNLLDDLEEGVVQIVFKPDLAARGSFIPGTNILYINPFQSRMLKPRNLKEMASTVIHEFTHFKGFNERQAFWNQLEFLVQLGHHTVRKAARNMEMVYYAKGFEITNRVGGRPLAKAFIYETKLWAYRQKYANRPFDKFWRLSPIAGNNIQKTKEMFLWNAKHLRTP